MSFYRGDCSLCSVPGQPNAVQRLCTTVVWQAPASPNGVITDYDIRFSSQGSDDTVRLAADVNFFVTEDEQQEDGVTVQVMM